MPREAKEGTTTAITGRAGRREGDTESRATQMKERERKRDNKPEHSEPQKWIRDDGIKKKGEDRDKRQDKREREGDG